MLWAERKKNENFLAILYIHPLLILHDRIFLNELVNLNHPHWELVVAGGHCSPAGPDAVFLVSICVITLLSCHGEAPSYPLPMHLPTSLPTYLLSQQDSFIFFIERLFLKLMRDILAWLYYTHCQFSFASLENFKVF